MNILDSNNLLFDLLQMKAGKNSVKKIGVLYVY